MRKIKRVLMVALALAMLIVALAACVKEEPANKTPAGDTNTPAQNTEPTKAADADTGKKDELPQETNNDLPKKEILTMATNADFPPYEFYKESKVVGIDAEIAEAIANKINMELSIEDIDFDSVIPSVATGKYSMAMAGLTITEERMESVSFSTSYAAGVQVIIVAEDSSITSVDDLFDDGAFHTIGVQLATTGDLYSTWDLEDEGLATIERYQKGADAVMALNSGKVDCVIIDNEPAKVFVSQNPGLKILDTEFAVEDYAIAVNKKDTELLEKIDNALKELIADGTVQSIIDKYINVN